MDSHVTAESSLIGAALYAQCSPYFFAICAGRVMNLRLSSGTDTLRYVSEGDLENTEQREALHERKRERQWDLREAGITDSAA